MGSLKSIRRPLLKEELDLISRRVDNAHNTDDAAKCSSMRESLEFQISIDETIKPENYQGLPQPQELYLLVVEPSFIIGFELGFMDGTLVTGRFPSARVDIACGLIDGRVTNDLPVSYAWLGDAIPIRSVEKQDCPPLDGIRSTFRSDWLYDAIKRQAPNR